MKRLAAACALALLAACGPGIDPAAARVQVEDAVKKYHQAYDQAEVQTVLDMLDPAVTISRPPDSFLSGKEACGAQLQKDMLRLKEQDRVGKRTTMFGVVNVTVEGTVAIATYVAIVRENKEQAHTLFTRAFRWDAKAKRWLILAEHYSFEPEKR